MTDTTTLTSPHSDIAYTSKKRISCDGGGGALGHPLVWYSLEDGEAVCEYCGRKFIYDPEKAAATN